MTTSPQSQVAPVALIIKKSNAQLCAGRRTQKSGGRDNAALRRSSRRARASRAAAPAHQQRRPSRWPGTARASGSGRRQGTPTASRAGSAPPRASGCGAPPGRPAAGWPDRTAPRATRPSSARGRRRLRERMGATDRRRRAADGARPSDEVLAPRRPTDCCDAAREKCQVRPCALTEFSAGRFFCRKSTLWRSRAAFRLNFDNRSQGPNHSYSCLRDRRARFA